MIDAAFAMACDIGIVSSLSEVAVDDADSDGGATRISLPDLRPSNTTARSRPPAPARSTWYAAFEAISITTRVASGSRLLSATRTFLTKAPSTFICCGASVPRFGKSMMRRRG